MKNQRKRSEVAPVLKAGCLIEVEDIASRSGRLDCRDPGHANTTVSISIRDSESGTSPTEKRDEMGDYSDSRFQGSPGRFSMTAFSRGWVWSHRSQPSTVTKGSARPATHRQGDSRAI